MELPVTASDVEKVLEGQIPKNEITGNGPRKAKLSSILSKMECFVAIIALADLTVFAANEVHKAKTGNPSSVGQLQIDFPWRVFPVKHPLPEEFHRIFETILI
jgi:hypothetical protein